MRRYLLAALCLLVAAAFAGLGVWQVDRRAWKLALIERVEARIHAPARSLPPRDRWSGDLAYVRVRFAGRYLPVRPALVQAVTARGGGWWVMAPMRTDVGVVLIDRGFVPSEQGARWRRPAKPDAATVTGLIRTSEPGGAFLRANDPAADRWYSRDVVTIGRARKLGAGAPFFVDADARPNPGGYPIGGLTVIAFRNDHLLYALTWFALAGLASFGAWRLTREPR